MDQFKGPCGVNLQNYDDVVVIQSNSSCKKSKKGKKCKKSCCCCKVIIFELTSTGSTASTGSSDPCNTTYVETYDPSPLAYNSLHFLPSALPDPLAQSTPNTGHVWFNTVSGNIYKQFPNGHWYHQGNLNTSNVNIFSSTTNEYQNVTSSGTVLSFPNSNINHPNFSPSGFTAPKTTEYYLHTSLSFVQNVPGSSLVEVEFVSKGVISQSISKRKVTLNFVHNVNSYYVDSLEFSTVSSLTQSNLIQVRVTSITSPQGSTLQVSSVDSSFDGYAI